MIWKEVLVLEVEVQWLSLTRFGNKYLEIKFVPVQAMKAYGGERGIALFILQLDTGCKSGVKFLFLSPCLG